MSTIKYLGEAKKKLGLKSSNALAKHLGISQQSISLLEKKKRVMDVWTATRLAEILEKNPMEIIAEAEEEREKDEKRKAYWRQVGAKVAATGLMLVFFGFNFNALETPREHVSWIMRKLNRRGERPAMA